MTIAIKRTRRVSHVAGNYAGLVNHVLSTLTTIWCEKQKHGEQKNWEESFLAPQESLTK